MIDELYNTAILTLAAGIAHIGSLKDPQGEASKTAKLCGSTITIQLKLDDQNNVSEFAQNVKACALGQAAAAILGEKIIGANYTEIKAARDDLWAMIKDETPMPNGRFEDLRKLMAVSNFPQRHTSTCLAFDAAVNACEQAMASRNKT